MKKLGRGFLPKFYMLDCLSVFLIKSRLGKVNSMLFYNKIAESESIDSNHIGLDTSKECNICPFYFFKDRNFLYQPLVCSRCHGASLRAILLTDIKLFQLRAKPTESLGICHIVKVIVCLSQVA